MVRSFAALALILVVEEAHAAVSCSGPIGPSEVVACGLEASLDVRYARQELAVIAGRRRTASTWLPSNPVLSLAVDGRWPGAAESAQGQRAVLDGYVSLSQEVEVAGQRGLRIELADAEARAAARRVVAAEQTVGAAALDAWLVAGALEELAALAREIDDVASAMARLAEARHQESLLSTVDADLAAAEAVRYGVARVDIERRRGEAGVVLATLLGLPPDATIAARSALVPSVRLDGASLAALTEHALAARGEIAAAQTERQVAEHEVAVLARSRVPNPTLTLSIARDGFDESVVGLGVAVPLLLPSPIGHDRSGEIDEARARQARTETSLEAVRRRVRAEVATAFAVDEARAALLARYSPELVARARRDLRSLSDAIGARELPLRDALLAQRTFIELLEGELEARLARSRARVELLRASAWVLDDTASARSAR